MEIDVEVAFSYSNGKIDIRPSLMNLGPGSVLVLDYRLIFPDGNALDVTREEAPKPDLSDFATELLSGDPVWCRAAVRYVVDETRPGCLIKDFCMRRTEAGDIVIVQSKLREAEGLGVVALESSNDLVTATAHFETALSNYEAEQNQFAINEVSQPFSYVLMTAGRLDEAGFLLRSAIGSMGEGPPCLTRMRLLSNLGNVQLSQEQAHAALSTFKEVLEMAITVAVPASIGFAQSGIGSSLSKQGKKSEGAEWLRRSVETARAEGNQLGLSRRLQNLAAVLKDLQQHAEVERAVAEALEIVIEIRDFLEAEKLCRLLWETCSQTKNFALFCRMSEGMLQTLPEKTPVKTRLHILTALAASYSDNAQAARAVATAEEALAIARQNDELIAEMAILLSLGGYYAKTGKHSRAQNALRESMRLAAKSEAWTIADMAKKTLAKINADSEDREQLHAVEEEYTELLSDWWFSRAPSQSEE